MPLYVVTETAGDEVAGRKSPGIDAEISLTEAQAAHALRLGHLRLAVVPPATAPEPTRKRRRRRK